MLIIVKGGRIYCKDADPVDYAEYCREPAYQAYRSLNFVPRHWLPYSIDKDGRINDSMLGEVHCRFPVQDAEDPRGWNACGNLSDSPTQHLLHLCDDHDSESYIKFASPYCTASQVRDWYYELMKMTVAEMGPYPALAYMSFLKTIRERPDDDQILEDWPREHRYLDADGKEVVEYLGKQELTPNEAVFYSASCFSSDDETVVPEFVLRRPGAGPFDDDETISATDDETLSDNESLFTTGTGDGE